DCWMLSRRPMHLSPAQQMQVQMEDCLSGVRADVINGAKAVIKLALAGEFGGNELAIADQLRVSLGRLINANDVLLGDDENVRWRSRLDVFKGEDSVVFVHFL